MKVMIPTANVISIGQDRYLFLSAGKAEYKWFCDNVAKKFSSTCITRAKLYFFIEDRTDISYIKHFFNLCQRNIKMTKGKYSGVKINLYVPTAIKKDIRELLYQYKGLYHLDGTDWIHLTVPGKRRYTGEYSIYIRYSFNEGFSVVIDDYVKDSSIKIHAIGVKWG